jgi:uncharacterized protein DUF3455
MRTILSRAAAAALTAASAISMPGVLNSAPASGEMLIATLHAEGAQVYHCKLNAEGKLAWQFREPVATLLQNGETVGRHYAGPSWEMRDGSVVSAKVTAQAPGATHDDIPLLLLEVTGSRGRGLLNGVTTIHRLNTVGGLTQGPCVTAGAFKSVPYSADYAFIRRGP